MEPQSPFANAIGKLASQDAPDDSIIIDTTTAPDSTTTDTTSTTDQTTDAPDSTTTDTTDAPAEATIIDELKAQYGVDEELENSVEGLQSLITKVTEKSKAEALKAKFEARPILGQLDAHLESGKSIESFFEVKSIEAQKITLPKLTGDEKADAQAKAYFKQVMSANYKASGLSDKQIQRIIESSELDNTLLEDAEEAAADWNKKIDSEVTSRTQQEETARLAQIEADKQTIANINTILSTGKLNGAVIPVEDVQAMKDFTLKTDDKGFTPRDHAFSKLTLEQQLLIDYLVYKNFNIKGLTIAAPKGTPLNLPRKNPLVGNDTGSEGNAAEKNNLPPSLRTLDFKQLNGQIPVL